MLFCIFLKFNPFVKIPPSGILRGKPMSVWCAYLVKIPFFGVKLIEISAPVPIKPSGAIYGVKVIFVYAFNTGIAEPVYLAAPFVRLLNKPRESPFIYWTGDFLCYYSTDSHIWVVFTHTQKIIFPPAFMPYRDRRFPC